MFTFIVRFLWILLCTLPLALAAFHAPGVSYDKAVSVGVFTAYFHVMLSVGAASYGLVLLSTAHAGRVESFKDLREMLARRERLDFNTQLFVTAFTLSTIILLLAVEAYIPAVLISVMIVVNLLIRGGAQSLLDKQDMLRRATPRRGM